MNIKLLQQLSESSAVSGFEFNVHELIKKNLKGYQFTTDNLNNLIAHPLNIDENKKTIVLDAHVDEVGFLVQSIKKDGRIKFLNIGGVGYDLASTAVIIHGETKIRGVIGAVPPHFKSESMELVIDLGTSSYEQTCALGIQIGDQITFDTSFSFEEKTNTLIGKAFDNRLGVFTILEALKDLQTDNNIIAIFSAQEEVGTRGIKHALTNIQADYAIVLESTPSDDTLFNDTPNGVLNKGPQVRLYDPTTIVNPLFVKEIRRIVNASNINAQFAVRTGGGTNASQFVLANFLTLIIAVPTRYIHSSYALCKEDDVKNTILLTKEFLMKL